MARSALLIGVSRYDEGFDERIGPAVRVDIASMQRLVLGLGWTVEAVLGAEGDAVSAIAVKRAVGALLHNAGPGDELLVYFSGHGVRRDGVDHLVPTEGWPDDPAGPLASLVALTVFEHDRERSAAAAVTFVVDACRDGDVSDAPDVELWTPQEGKALTFLFAARAGQAAGTTPGASVLTRALSTVVPHLPPRARLATVVEALQRAVAQLTPAGQPVQHVDCAGNVTGFSAPFPLHGAGIPSRAPDTWSRALEKVAGNGDAAWLAPLDALGAVLDEIESAAPDLGDGVGATIWHEPGVVERLARAVVLLVEHGAVESGAVEPGEAPLLLALTAVLDAAVRRGERELLDGAGSPRRDAVLAGSPRLREAVEREDDPTGPVTTWVAHLAAAGHAGATGREAMLADIVRVLAALPDPPEAAKVTRAGALLVETAVAVLDPARIGSQLVDARWSSGAREHRPSAQRLATALALVRTLALDTRGWSSGFGPQVVDRTPTGVPALLAALDEVEWVVAGRVLSLRADCDDAVLDHELRAATSRVSEQLLEATQPGRELAGRGLPVAAVADGLEPEPGSYQLPHISFEVSTSELYGLLMGTTLYGDRMLAVREVYQNAVDACRQREHRDARASLPPHRSAIRFEVREVDGRLALDCLDDGVGMSRHELRSAFARVGGRFHDLPDYIEEQPGDGPAFHPISQFGIGVLSYFMIADRVELWTRRRRGATADLHPGLHVTISDGADLFRVHTAPSRELTPDVTGTRMRLHLKPDIAAEAVLAALGSTVRAPLVDVDFADLRPEGTVPHRGWSAGLLYSPDGALRTDCLAYPELGVYLHPGEGEVLVNGIAVGSAPRWEATGPWPVWEGTPPALEPAGPLGVTFSIDGRCRPQLSVDRRTLHSYDEEQARTLLIRAVDGRLREWDEAGSWLRDVFRADGPAAREGFAVLRDMTLTATSRATTESVRFVPRLHGVPLAPRSRRGDPSDPGVNKPFGTHLAHVQHQIARADDHVHLAGLPPLDDRLASAMVMAGDEAVPLERLCAIARELGKTPGAVAVYLWAIGVLDRPIPLLLPAALAHRHADHVDATARRPPPLDTVLVLDAEYGLATAYADISAFGISELAARMWSGPVRSLGATWLLRWDDVVRLSHSRAGRGANHSDVVAALRELAPIFGEPVADVEHALDAHLRHHAPLAETAADPPVALSPGARQALSVLRVGDAPPWYATTIPALKVAVVAHGRGTPVHELVSELTTAGYDFVPASPTWSTIDDAGAAAARLRMDGRLVFDDEGRVEIGIGIGIGIGGIDLLPALRRALDADTIREAAAVLKSHGLAGPTIAALATTTLPPLPQLARDAELLDGIGSANPWTLARVADDGAYTLGEAFDLMVRYRAFLDWELPDTLPVDVAEHRPATGVRAVQWEWPDDDLSLADLALRLVVASAKEGTVWEDLVADVLPVAELAGLDPARLALLTNAVDGAATFDDLLVLGTQQFEPPFRTVHEVDALARPFAREPDALAARVRRWLAVTEPPPDPEPDSGLVSG